MHVCLFRRLLVAKHAVSRNKLKTRNGETMKRFLWLSAFIMVISGATAQTGANPKSSPSKSSLRKAAGQARVSAEELQELRQALAAQQKQADEQRQQLDQLKSQLQQLLDATQQANASAQKVQGSAEQAQTTAV